MNFEVNSTDDELILKSLESKIKKYMKLSINDNGYKINKKGFHHSKENISQEKILIIPQKIEINCIVKPDKDKKKEPRFIPYEPYKACIKPILPPSEKHSIVPKFVAEKEAPECSDSLKSALSKVNIDENKLDSCDTNELRVEVENLKKEVSTLNHLLSVQTQVNNDLKKLLVASLGEDVEEKIHCLSEERARMAGMIRKYSEKLDSDYEEKERITIDCDVWKSKFYASSLLIEEIAESKHELYQHLKEASSAVQLLLDERNVINPLLLNSYRQIRQIQLAFDPLHSETSPSTSPTNLDILTLSSSLSVSTDNVRNRLLGTFNSGSENECVEAPFNYRTPGENIANQALKKCKTVINNYTRLPLVKKSVMPYQYHRDSHLTMNCCKHCNGDIVLV